MRLETHGKKSNEIYWQFWTKWEFSNDWDFFFPILLLSPPPLYAPVAASIPSSPLSGTSCPAFPPTLIVCSPPGSRLQRPSNHIFLSLWSAGVSSDPALHADLYPRRRDEAHHSAGTEPSAAAVRPEELRVHLPHPGQHLQRAGAAL